MKKRFLIVFVLMAVVAGGLYGYQLFVKKMMGQFFAAMANPPPAPVAVAEAVSMPVPRTLEGIGTITAVRQVTISPEVSGRISEILFEAGQSVAQGDILAHMNDDQEKADLEIYRAQAKLAELNLNRSSKLVDVASPRSTVDQYRASLDEARGAIARTEAQIAKKTIAAPFDGVLGIRQINLGQYLNPGEPMITLTDLSELFVNFTLPEQTLAELKTGQAVSLTVDAYPQKKFAAVINAIEPQVGQETRTVKVQASMKNPDNLLSPGMYAKVRVSLPQGAPAVIVPETAVDFTIYGDSVYVLRVPQDAAQQKNEQGDALFQANRVYVKSGARFDNKVAILEGDIRPGDKVVTTGQLKVNPGALVKIAPVDGLAKNYESIKDNIPNE
ncbi:MAG: efflux RND transporter periplasmic adaptor subunit [Micavibrio aeruginosavorus]|uniref:Efflux RND transporter periplasmic adaptor subunit n=1 Tax=Micavibrio aeruginosavorus TaxID=349221 RepID=A0A7T5R1D7_9BACT|nr:MAG: efflux RND transporter periplasmic adaptor subunit [Micavibrio aeruginosavorus]